MRRATVESIIRWVSFGSSAMPRLPPLADHEDPVELDDRLVSLVEPARADPDESESGPAAGFADLGDLGLGVQRVPVEHRSGESDVLEAHLEAVSARQVDEEARRDRDGQEAVRAPPAEERFPGERPAGVVLVEVDLVPVSRQQGEPHIVRLRDGPSDLAAHLGPDPEVLEKWPVLVHAIPGRKRRSKRNERCGGDESSPKGFPPNPRQTAGGEAASASGGARGVHPEHSTNEESYEGKQLSTAITSCSPTSSP